MNTNKPVITIKTKNGITYIFNIINVNEKPRYEVSLQRNNYSKDINSNNNIQCFHYNIGLHNLHKRGIRYSNEPITLFYGSNVNFNIDDGKDVFIGMFLIVTDNAEYKENGDINYVNKLVEKYIIINLENIIYFDVDKEYLNYLIENRMLLNYDKPKVKKTRPKLRIC